MAGALPAPRVAALRNFRAASGTTIDSGLVLHFPAPHSFPGEHVVELQAHGSPVALELLVRAACAAGARPARAGELPARAFHRSEPRRGGEDIAHRCGFSGLP